MVIIRYLFAAIVLALSLWYTFKPIDVIKGGTMEKHLYKKPNRTRVIWFVRICGIVGIFVSFIIAFGDQFFRL